MTLASFAPTDGRLGATGRWMVFETGLPQWISQQADVSVANAQLWTSILQIDISSTSSQSISRPSPAPPEALM